MVLVGGLLFINETKKRKLKQNFIHFNSIKKFSVSFGFHNSSRFIAPIDFCVLQIKSRLHLKREVNSRNLITKMSTHLIAELPISFIR